jgi:hypothetical protein
MKINVSRCEYWPYYGLDDELPQTGPWIDLTEAELKEYKNVMSEFRAWQERLQASYEKTGGPKW